MNTSVNATGRRELRDGVPYVVLERQFTAPAEAVWAAITEPTRLECWIGTWAGDPADGFVDFRMTAEGDDVPVERFTILDCDPPRRLVVESVSTADDGTVERWRLELDVVEDGSTTTLVFAQALPNPGMAESVGPGWEYYLDRLAAVETGADATTVDWDDYYPALSSSYATMFTDNR